MTADNSTFRTAKQIQGERREQNRKPREQRKTTFRVEAWGMPDQRCKDQTQRILIDTKMIDARHQEEACDIYRQESGAPEEAYKNRYKVGPLVIVRAFRVAADAKAAPAPFAKFADLGKGVGAVVTVK